MTAVFADTFYYLALLNPDDRRHEQALTAAQSQAGLIITTEYVLIEVGDAMADPMNRPLFLNLLKALRVHSKVRVIDCSPSLFAHGVALYAQRLDKAWSLTDCISFVVMRNEGITEALTGDRHFEQAGFVALMR